MVTWDCRNCGHKHADDAWLATPEPRHCHACGALAVQPSGHPNHAPEPLVHHQLNKRYPLEPEPEPTPEPEPEPAPEPEPEPPPIARVKVPETIQVTKQGTVKKKPTRRRK